MDAAAFHTATLDRHPRGHDIAAILSASVAAVDPYAAVRRRLRRSGSQLHVGDTRYDLHDYRGILLLAVGKAALPMARAALDLLQGEINAGLVVPKASPGSPVPALDNLLVIPAGHPMPDERSMEAGRRAVEWLEGADERDLVLVLLSGGGSALLTWPEDDLTLDDMRGLTDALLASGATINEINALRKRCDRVKGGGLARAAYPATVAVLVLSDVVGDDLGSIASGPFIAIDSSRGREGAAPTAIVARYNLHRRLPARVVALLDQPAPLPEPEHFARVRHTIVGSVEVAARGAIAEARARGYRAELLTTTQRGEAREVGRDLARRLVGAGAEPRPLCLVAGGETTVTLQGHGLGGRNQELALSAVEALAGRHDLLLVALATDGGDGPTDAAGAVVDGQTLARGRTLGLEPAAFLRDNDAYHYFEPLGDLLKPGPTETNVNDLALLFAF
jgi:hydroxypyruvate reductase